MKRFVFDLETNGLLQEVTKIHCISVVDMDSSYSELFIGDEGVRRFLALISSENAELIGHNVFNFDMKVLEKLYGYTHKGKIHDTMILGQLLFSDLKNDDLNNSHDLPGKIFSKKETGSHSLKAWGQRIHCFKGEYVGGWEEYNEDMGRYCIQDTYTTKALFSILNSRIENKLIDTRAIDLEYEIAPILARQQAHGVLFDTKKANELLGKLTQKSVELKWKLQELFKPRYIFLEEFTPKRDNRNQGIKTGATFSKIELEEFNPNSRSQIIDRLKKEFNWNPEEFTEKGNPKMDEDIIDNLPFKELSPLKEYLLIKKRISQIDGGDHSWTKHIGKDGRIRGSIRQNGTVTGRMAHFWPNLAQVPSKESLYGPECRELFIVPEDKVMIGMDADALEMRCLGGYLSLFDNGRFITSLLHGKKEEGTDPHSINAEAMLIDREAAKTVFYAYIYGAKNAKVGLILKDHGINFLSYVPDFERSLGGLKRWVKEKNLSFSNAYMECLVVGKHCLKLFGDRIPELPQLNEHILSLLKERQFLKGLDGRKLFCRSQHGALNTALQSAGALIMKKTLSIVDQKMKEASLKNGIDYEFILNIHDELQLEVCNNKEIIDKVVKILDNSIKEASLYFNFPCPMKGNVKIGKNWSETH